MPVFEHLGSIEEKNRTSGTLLVTQWVWANLWYETLSLPPPRKILAWLTSKVKLFGWCSFSHGHLIILLYTLCHELMAKEAAHLVASGKQRGTGKGKNPRSSFRALLQGPNFLLLDPTSWTFHGLPVLPYTGKQSFSMWVFARCSRCIWTLVNDFNQTASAKTASLNQIANYLLGWQHRRL